MEKVPDTICSHHLFLMEKNAGNFLINNPLYFRNKVKNGGDWDLKNTPEYKSNFYGNGFIFKDKHIIFKNKSVPIKITLILRRIFQIPIPTILYLISEIKGVVDKKVPGVFLH